jgi:hypothetical protein
VSGANLLSWFSLGVLAAAPVAVLVPTLGMALAFLVTMFGLLGALLAHAVAEDLGDRAAVVRVAAAYLLSGAAASGAGMWWMTLILMAAGVATALQAYRWAESRPREAATAA